jgi:ketol-acid reductoisomerase
MPKIESGSPDSWLEGTAPAYFTLRSSCWIIKTIFPPVDMAYNQPILTWAVCDLSFSCIPQDGGGLGMDPAIPSQIHYFEFQGANVSEENATIRHFTSKDADPKALDGERIAVLGYGHLGQPFALNLRDSGVGGLVIGNIADDYAAQARRDGFTVLPIGEAVAGADVILVLLPDEVIPEVFNAEVLPNLHARAAISFASGYNLAYHMIQPPDNVDVLLLAPRMAGENARQRFLNGQGFYAFVSVEQDASGKAWKRLLGLANGVGVLKAGALELDAQKEADLDLLVEQTTGAVIGVGILSAFSMGVDAGIPPEAMVLEMYMSEEMEMVFRSFREKGFFEASRVHGPTALFGGYQRTMRLLQSELMDIFQETFTEIQNGEFASKFQAERQAGYPTMALAEAMSMDDSPQSLAEASLRRMLGSS